MSKNLCLFLSITVITVITLGYYFTELTVNMIQHPSPYVPPPPAFSCNSYGGVDKIIGPVKNDNVNTVVVEIVR